MANAKQIWYGKTNPSVVNKTDYFFGCDFLLINGLEVDDDQYEIAACVEIEVIANTTYLNQEVKESVTLGKKEIPMGISFFDTSMIILLPAEATNSGCRCRVFISTSYSVNIEIYAVSKT